MKSRREKILLSSISERVYVSNLGKWFKKINNEGKIFLPKLCRAWGKNLENKQKKMTSVSV